MAKYTVTLSCGHTEVLRLLGPHEKREKTINWMEDSGVCEACRREMKEKERQIEADKAASLASQRGLRPLTLGTERQITWAETIRIRIFDSVLAMYGSAAKAADSGDPRGRIAEQSLMATLDWLREQLDAKWWIERRVSDTKSLILESPYTTEEAAIHLGVHKDYLIAREEAAKRAAIEEQQEFHQSRLRFLRNLKWECQKRLGEIHGDPTIPIKIGLFGSRSNELRIYVGRFGSNVAVYHPQGNRYVPPDTLEYSGAEEHREETHSICRQLADHYKHNKGANS